MIFKGEDSEYEQEKNNYNRKRICHITGTPVFDPSIDQYRKRIRMINEQKMLITRCTDGAACQGDILYDSDNALKAAFAKLCPKEVVVNADVDFEATPIPDTVKSVWFDDGHVRIKKFPSGMKHLFVHCPYSLNEDEDVITKEHYHASIMRIRTTLWRDIMTIIDQSDVSGVRIDWNSDYKQVVPISSKVSSVNYRV